MNRVELAPKLAQESVPRTFDFTAKLPQGVTLTAASVYASVYSGNTSNPQAIVGTVTYSGTVATVVVTGGGAGCLYELKCVGQGSDGNEYILVGYLAVTPDLP